MLKLKKMLVSSTIAVLLVLLSVSFASASSKSGVINGSIVNVRQEPNTDSKVINQLSKDTPVKILDSEDDWYKITYGETTGWVYADYVTLDKGTTSVKKETGIEGTISANDAVNFRTSPDLSADVIRTLEDGEKVNVLGVSGDWYKVKDSEGDAGWVYSKYVSVKTSRGISSIAPDSTASDSDSSTARKIISYAKRFLGVRYVWGGTSPSGFDCSGLTQYVFGKYGVDLERVAADQATQGKKVLKANLRPGDLVFFDTSGRRNNSIDHVGIYIGDGKFIHAASGRSRVIITELSEDYYERAYMTARRVL